MIKVELLEKDDLNKILEWNANKSAEDLLQWAGPGYSYPLTCTQLEDYLENVKKDDSNINAYKIVLTDAGEVVGSVELSLIDEDNKTGKVCKFLIGEEQHRGKGIGKKALNELLRIGFEEMKFEKIVLKVFDHNHGAIKCYEDVGFSKDNFIENLRKTSTGYWSLYEMGILKEKWDKKDF